jgi:uncharacterized membrane protein
MTTLVLITNVGVSILLIALAVPLLKGLVAPNSWYGVRIPKSLASAENWYRINRYGAKQLVGWSGVSLVVTVSGFFLTIEEASPLFWFYLLIPAIAALIACLFTLVWSRRV